VGIVLGSVAGAVEPATAGIDCLSGKTNAADYLYGDDDPIVDATVEDALRPMFEDLELARRTTLEGLTGAGVPSATDLVNRSPLEITGIVDTRDETNVTLSDPSGTVATATLHRAGGAYWIESYRFCTTAVTADLDLVTTILLGGEGDR
jgi:hypothetical protein